MQGCLLFVRLSSISNSTMSIMSADKLLIVLKFSLLADTITERDTIRKDNMPTYCSMKFKLRRGALLWSVPSPFQVAMSVSQPSYVSEATTAWTSCCSTPTPTPTGTWPYSSVSGEKAWPTFVFVVESFLQTYKENASEPSLSHECKGGWSHTCHRCKKNKNNLKTLQKYLTWV